MFFTFFNAWTLLKIMKKLMKTITYEKYENENKFKKRLTWKWWTWIQWNHEICWQLWNWWTWQKQANYNEYANADNSDNAAHEDESGNVGIDDHKQTTQVAANRHPFQAQRAYCSQCCVAVYNGRAPTHISAKNQMSTPRCARVYTSVGVLVSMFPVGRSLWHECARVVK